MQKVSRLYKDSMKAPLRERAYMMLLFGLVNQEAQAKAEVVKGTFTYFSNESSLFKEFKDNGTYATLEENFTKVDGSMSFLPREKEGSLYNNTGLVCEKLVSDGEVELLIKLNMLATNFKGLSVDFGDNYPVDFDVISSTGQIVSFRDNDKSKWSTEEVWHNTVSLRFVFLKMRNPHSRVRIRHILFGYGLVYYNDSIINSSLESYVSPIAADVPQIDFSVTLINENHYFDVDNPNSAINYLETGQEMTVMYGYQLPDSENIEWIQGGKLLCSEWESDDSTATIRSQDALRQMNSDFNKGRKVTVPRSYYDMAKDVLMDAKHEQYYIDPRLKSLFTTNPIPRVSHKAALQIIANACRCVLTQTRQGFIQIKSNFVPEVTISVNEEAPYSKIANILKPTEKIEYESFSEDYTSVDGKMKVIPKTSHQYLETGFISKTQSNDDCTFVVNPVITFKQEAICMHKGIKFEFGNSLPSEFIIRTFIEHDMIVERVVTSSEISKTTVLVEDFDDFDIMQITFTKTAVPHNRIVINHFALGDVTDFTMERLDMTSSPKAIKQELVKEVIVPYYLYQTNSQEDNLVSEEINVKSGDILTFYTAEPCYSFKSTLNGSPSNVSIVSEGSYCVSVKVAVTGKYRLEIFAHRYKIVQKQVLKELHIRGKTVKWENPLIDNFSMANDLANWIADYYESGIEYEYETRGNPEIDVNDIIYQENEFYKNMRVTVCRHRINFNNSFSGKITTRRQGE